MWTSVNQSSTSVIINACARYFEYFQSVHWWQSITAQIDFCWWIFVITVYRLVGAVMCRSLRGNDGSAFLWEECPFKYLAKPKSIDYIGSNVLHLFSHKTESSRLLSLQPIRREQAPSFSLDDCLFSEWIKIIISQVSKSCMLLDCLSTWAGLKDITKANTGCVQIPLYTTHNFSQGCLRRVNLHTGSNPPCFPNSTTPLFHISPLITIQPAPAAMFPIMHICCCILVAQKHNFQETWSFRSEAASPALHLPHF